MRAVIMGGTGLIGSRVIAELLAEPSCSQVVGIGRRSQGLQHQKWLEKVGSMSDLETLCADMEADIAFCCLGTTIGKAGSKEAFAEIDRHLPVRFARAAQKRGVKSFHIVSSLGANARSSNFYLQTKGLMEEELRSLGLPNLGIYRPSLLMGMREESRPLERISILGYQFLKGVYPRFLQAWQPIEAEDVARMMVAQTLSPSMGNQIFENKDIHAHAAAILLRGKNSP